MKSIGLLDEEDDHQKKNPLLADSENTSYFQSKKHEIAFYFKMNNVNFDKYLGIKKIHMTDLSKAKELKNSYIRIFHPDSNVNSTSELNFTEICQDINNTFHRVSSGKL